MTATRKFWVQCLTSAIKSLPQDYTTPHTLDQLPVDDEPDDRFDNDEWEALTNGYLGLLAIIPASQSNDQNLLYALTHDASTNAQVLRELFKESVSHSERDQIPLGPGFFEEADDDDDDDQDDHTHSGRHTPVGQLSRSSSTSSRGRGSRIRRSRVRVHSPQGSHARREMVKDFVSEVLKVTRELHSLGSTHIPDPDLDKLDFNETVECGVDALTSRDPDILDPRLRPILIALPPPPPPPGPARPDTPP